MNGTIDDLIPDWREKINESSIGSIKSNMAEMLPILKQLVKDRNIEGIQEFYQKVCTDTVDMNDDRDPFFYKFLMQFCNVASCDGVMEERPEPLTKHHYLCFKCVYHRGEEDEFSVIIFFKKWDEMFPEYKYLCFLMYNNLVGMETYLHTYEFKEPIFDEKYMVQCNNLVLPFKLEGTEQENLLYPAIHYNEDWISFIYDKLERMGLYARNVLINGEDLTVVIDLWRSITLKSNSLKYILGKVEEQLLLRLQDYHVYDNEHFFMVPGSINATKTIVDSHTKTYTQYDFEYNPSNRNNKVTFPSRRRSIMFFKYSKTNYSYNGNSVQSAVGQFKNAGKTQTESYYISQVLFKSNYTSKYKKELEAQGADYIEDKDVYGNLTDAWIDMVNQNKFAIVSAGQGFELRVTLKYENSFLTQYLARYFGTDDGQNDILGTSNRVQKRYNDVPANSRQYANISALTGKDGRTAPYYRNTERAYISSYSILDRLAVNLVTGANVFNDLYVFMSDNPDTVYSYSGIYDTPVVFERDIKYSADYSVTTVTYTMCVSHENGISSNLQKMKFYTNQLAPDKRTPGIVEGTYDVASQGEHSITIWTPIVAATPFDYPNTIQDRYIGDAIELGYTIKTTGADDSIVHIVQ